MRLLAGVDVGGTFTDIVCRDVDTGKEIIAKTLSTYPSFIQGIFNGFKEIGIHGKDVESLRHGSTVGINAIVQRKGAKTGLLTTHGFRDVLLDARADREDPFESLLGSTSIPCSQKRYTRN